MVRSLAKRTGNRSKYTHKLIIMWLSKELRRLYWRGDVGKIEAYQQRLTIHLESKRLKPEIQARLKHLLEAASQISATHREKQK